MSDLGAISPFTEYINSILNLSLPTWTLISLAIIIYWFFLFLPPIVVIQYIDRKIAADIQMRIGPNRASAYGLLQFFADGVKLFFKEDLLPKTQDDFLSKFGPIVTLAFIFLAISCIPFSKNWVLSSTPSDLIIIICALVFSNIWLFLSGYSSKKNSYVAASFQFLVTISLYLVPLILSIVPVILMSRSLNLVDIVSKQGGLPWQWFVFHDPGMMISMLTLLSALHIWQSRSPFERNNKILLEYSGVRKGFFTLIEYSSFFLSSCFIVALYLGGGQMPFRFESMGLSESILEWGVFISKALFLILLSVWMKWSLPRLKNTQIIYFSWNVLLPAGFLGLMVSVLWLVLTRGRGIGEFL